MAYLGTPIDTTNQFQSLVGKRFSGDASTTAFTLDVAPTSTLDIEVFVENVRQDPNSAYSLSGTTLTFAAAPPSGTNNIYVVHQAKAVGTISPAAGTVNADSFDNTVISGHTALAAIPATTDELLISDAGTVKRIDAQFFQNTPAFMAKMSADQDFTTSTLTKVQFDTEIFDTHSAYDHSTNYRFTPGVAGTYFLFAQVHGKSNGNQQLEDFRIDMVKNGTQIFSTRHNPATYDANQIALNMQVLDLADADDYYEVKTFLDDASGNPTIESDDGAGATSYFGAYKLIGI